MRFAGPIFGRRPVSPEPPPPPPPTGPVWSASPVFSVAEGEAITENLPVFAAGSSITVGWVAPGAKPSWVTFSPPQAIPTISFSGAQVDANDIASMVLAATANSETVNSPPGSITVDIPAADQTPPTWETVETFYFYAGVSGALPAASYVDSFSNRPLSISYASGSLPPGVTFNPALQQYEHDGTGQEGQFTTTSVLAADDGLAELPQYRVSDMVTSGPNRAYFNSRLDIAWANPDAGDWMDANQVAQGSTAWATLAISATGSKNWTVTNLVSRWMTNGLNRGFYLRGSGTAFTFDFAGRLNATSANRPQLSVTTNNGTFNCPCLASAWFETSSHTVNDGTSTFRCSQSARQAIVQFDLSAVTGTVSSATLTLFCSAVGASGSVVIMEANPPSISVGGGGQEAILGLAASYTYDQGIDGHADVLFATDFPDLTQWEPISVPTLPDPTIEFDVESRTNSTHVRNLHETGQLGGPAYRKYVMRGTSTGSIPDVTETELYFRYYLYMEDDWGSEVDSNKMPGFDMRLGRWSTQNGGYWDPITGNGGSRGDGKKYNNTEGPGFQYQGTSARGHGGMKAFDGHVYDDIFALRTYMYHLDQEGDFGNEVRWGNCCLGKNRWFCIEQYMRMNSLTGSADSLGNQTAVADGLFKVWVDGVLVLNQSGYRWRCHSDMGIHGIWMDWFHGGTEARIHDMHTRMNHVVIARSYIGPRRPV